MTLEEGLVGCDVLDADDGVGAQRNDLVYQLHRIAVGQQFTDAVHVHHGLLIGVVDGGLHFVLADILTHQTGKLVVDGVTRTGGDNPSLDGFADESHVANDVKQFVACTLILPYQGLVLDIT